MNGDEWRSFTRVTEAPLYYEQFGGIDPWAAANWHLALDQLDSAVTGRALPHGGLLDHMRQQQRGELELPRELNAPHYHFYLNYLRHLHKLRTLSRKAPLKPIGVDSSQFGQPRTEEPGPPPPKRSPGTPPSLAGSTIETVELEPRAALVVEGKTDLPNYLGSALTAILKVSAYANSKGIDRAGPSFIRHLAIDEDGTIHYAAGLPVQEGGEGDGDIMQRQLPGGQALMLEFSGDYGLALAGKAWSHRLSVKA